jgi:hypothetical protein
VQPDVRVAAAEVLSTAQNRRKPRGWRNRRAKRRGPPRHLSFARSGRLPSSARRASADRPAQRSSKAARVTARRFTGGHRLLAGGWWQAFI